MDYIEMCCHGVANNWTSSGRKQCFMVSWLVRTEKSACIRNCCERQLYKNSRIRHINANNNPQIFVKHPAHTSQVVARFGIVISNNNVLGKYMRSNLYRC